MRRNLNALIGFLFVLDCTFVSAVSASNLDTTVPPKMLGAWAKQGKCTVPAAKLIITINGAQFGDNPPVAMRYFSNDGPAGQGALHWVEQGVVSNIEYDPKADTLILHMNGWGYTNDHEIYKRCQKSVTS